MYKKPFDPRPPVRLFDVGDQVVWDDEASSAEYLVGIGKIVGINTKHGDVTVAWPSAPYGELHAHPAHKLKLYKKAVGVTTTEDNGPTINYIEAFLWPEFWTLFSAKHAEYSQLDGFEPHRVLGEQGQFAEIFRKVFKLKRAMWDGQELVTEGKREVLLDLIGHCFLALELIDREAKGATNE